MVHLQCLSFFLRKLFLLFGCKEKTKIRDFSAEGPPVPIPNTEVKLCWGDNTCLETSREDSSLRIFFILANNEEVGIPTAEGPPVPIPNTEVKLCWGDNTCLETSREDSSLRIFKAPRITGQLVFLQQRVHLFPFRTQKLSSAEATILAWRRAGKIAQCQHHPIQLTVDPR